MTIIKRISPLSLIEHKRDINGVAQEDVDKWLDAPRSCRPLVHKAFPGCTKEELEFILTGIPREEWQWACAYGAVPGDSE
ncbi:MAG: hypothetical protein ACREBU_02690 [Nitrososphaera sp.]